MIALQPATGRFAVQLLLIAGLATLLTAAALPRPALALHLAATLAALPLGLFIMWRRKGTVEHRALGRLWVALMMLAALSSFWLNGLNDGFSVVHLLSAWTLVALALAIRFIRKGDVKHHKRFMVGSLLGLLGAGLGALAPGRMLYRFFFALAA